MIEIVFPDGKKGEVETQSLQGLIENLEITSFRRASSWVALGRDPVRRSQRKVRCIPERRGYKLSTRK
jgi:hypothetical protein